MDEGSCCTVFKPLYPGNEQISQGRPPFEKKSTLASPEIVVNFEDEVHLSAKRKTSRSVYCRTKEAEVRSNIEYFTCKLAFCLIDRKIFFIIGFLASYFELE